MRTARPPSRALARARALARSRTLAATLALVALVVGAAFAPPPYALLAAARAADGTTDEALREPLERFPRTQLLVDTGGRTHAFEVWVADTPPRRAQGLMWVRDLPADRGMLFLFDTAQPVSFWMKNTYVALDLLFVAPDGRIIRIAENAAPHSAAPIDSMGVVNAVLELRGGTARRLGIRPGHRLRTPAAGR